MRAKVIYSYTRLRAALVGLDPSTYAKYKNVTLISEENAVSISNTPLSYPFTLTQFLYFLQSFQHGHTPLPPHWYIPEDTDPSKGGFQVWVAEKLFATVDSMHEAHQLRDVYKARLRDDNTEATITIQLHEENSKNA